MKHLLSVADLDHDAIDEIMRLTDQFVEVSERQIPRVPALRGRTVVSLFYEESTRTRLSFETAAKRLSADTMNFSVATSSVKKGESLRDTVQTIEAMGVDVIVVRHASAGDRDLLTVETTRGAEQTISTAKYEVTGRGGKGRELLQRGQFTRIVWPVAEAPQPLNGGIT